MASFTLPPIESLTTLSKDQHAQVIDALFEPCETLRNWLDFWGVLSSHQYESYPHLIDAVEHWLSMLLQPSPNGTDENRVMLDAILGAHPRLGAKKVESVQSHVEQAQLNTGGAEEAEKLAALNEEYEKKFPGLRYVVFVNGRSRPVIMENMRSRIDRGDIALERKEAIKVAISLVFRSPLASCSLFLISCSDMFSFKAMCDIAKDRASKLQTA